MEEDLIKIDELVEAQQSAIEKKVAELKKEKALKQVFPIAIEGVEGEEKECYVGYFRQPTFAAFSKYLTLSQKDNAQAMRQLAKDCFLGGDSELVDDDGIFLFGTMGYLNRIIEMRNGKLVNLSKAGK